MKEKKHLFFEEVKEVFINKEISYIDCNDVNFQITLEKAKNKLKPIVTYGYWGQEDNGINGQFEVETIDTLDIYYIDNFYEELICNKFIELYSLSKVQDAYGTIWNPQEGIKIFNVYGDEDLMGDRNGFYDLNLTPLTIIYVGNQNKIYLESADLIYDYFEEEYQWKNYIKICLNPEIRKMIKDLGIGKRGYYRKENQFSFLIRDPQPFIKIGYEYNKCSGRIYIS